MIWAIFWCLVGYGVAHIPAARLTAFWDWDKSAWASFVAWYKARKA